jgi:undecaprenyl-diphosphatase
MDWWQALILGLVEGLTEYLPVSSTGHLLIAQRALGMPADEASNAFAICVQAGAIVAVLGLYFGRVKRMALGLFGRDTEGRTMLVCVVAGFMPAAVIGLLANDWIEERLFGWKPVAFALFVGGVGILVGERIRLRRRDERGPGLELDQLTWKAAVVIGLCQCVAMWPGTSRSLVTIVGGLLVGLRLRAAVEFSFLLGVVTLLAATGYTALKSGAVMVEAFGVPSLALGFAVACLSAVLSVKWMVGYLNKHGLGIFGWYRVALALVVAAAFWSSAE